MRGEEEQTAPELCYGEEQRNAPVAAGEHGVKEGNTGLWRGVSVLFQVFWELWRKVIRTDKTAPLGWCRRRNR